MDPRSVGLAQTTNGIWLRAPDLAPNRSRPAATKKTPRLRSHPRSGSGTYSGIIPGLEPAATSQHVRDATS
jgi:hypothetical protein